MTKMDGYAVLTAVALSACNLSVETKDPAAGGSFGDAGASGSSTGDGGDGAQSRGGKPLAEGGAQAEGGNEAGVSGEDGGAERGGAAQGGAAQAGAAEGGAAQAGAVQGGAVEGGAAQGGAAEAGTVQGGQSEGGKEQGGGSDEGGDAQGGSGEGGAAEGGSGQSGSGEAGESVGGAANGGTYEETGGSLLGGAGFGGELPNPCGPTQKPCNGGCIPLSECCGGCSGNQPVCNNGVCVGRALGDSCEVSEECDSQVCADHVCCNVECDKQCEACNTESARGTCSPTTTPRTPCTSDGTLCGGACDGTPAHRDACVYPNQGSVCAAGSCNSETNVQTNPRICDGRGFCGEATTKPCSPYTCQDSTSCATECPNGQDTCGGDSCIDLNTAAHCGSCQNVCTGTPTPYCTNSGQCVECLSDANCSSPTPRCFSNTCVECTKNSDCAGTGSTCNTTNHTCRCRLPNSGNLLKNPGFDGSLSQWNIPTYEGVPTLVTYDDDDDNDSCPASGSARMTYYGFAFGSINECVAVTAKTEYNFGYRFKQASLENEDAALCIVTSHAGSTCSGDSLDYGGTQYRSGPISTTWAYPNTTMTYTTAEGAGSVRVSCQSNSLADVWYDQIYLNASDYF